MLERAAPAKAHRGNGAISSGTGLAVQGSGVAEGVVTSQLRKELDTGLHPVHRYCDTTKKMVLRKLTRLSRRSAQWVAGGSEVPQANKLESLEAVTYSRSDVERGGATLSMNLAQLADQL